MTMTATQTPPRPDKRKTPCMNEGCETPCYGKECRPCAKRNRVPPDPEIKRARDRARWRTRHIDTEARRERERERWQKNLKARQTAEREAQEAEREAQEDTKRRAKNAYQSMLLTLNECGGSATFLLKEESKSRVATVLAVRDLVAITDVTDKNYAVTLTAKGKALCAAIGCEETKTK